MYCKELNKNFESKAKMFAELKANKDLLIKAKKSEIKCKRNDFNLMPAIDDVAKSVSKVDDNYIYPVISNTNYMDSHNDVHLNGSMTKTATEQNGKVFYLADHEMRVGSIIATPKNVEIGLKEMDWSGLGKSYEGKTQALMFKIPKNKIMLESAKRLIEDKEPMQNSIRMQYLKIDLAINDESEDYKDEYKTWLEVYPKIANKERANDAGYFFAVRELKIVNEGSMVLFGSNDATPIKDNEAVSDTSIKEPSKDTQMTVTQMLQKINV